MLQYHFGEILRTSAVVGSRQHNVDEVARKNEARHSAHVINRNGYGPLALLDDRRQRGSLVRRAHLRGDNRLVADKRGKGDPSAILAEFREVRERALRLGLCRPIDFSHVRGADWRSESKRVVRDQNRDGLLSVWSR